MKSIKSILVLAAIILAVVAVATRVAPIKKVVFGA
jgi:hypothetical protein